MMTALSSPGTLTASSHALPGYPAWLHPAMPAHALLGGTLSGCRQWQQGGHSSSCYRTTSVSVRLLSGDNKMTGQGAEMPGQAWGALGG